MISIVIARYGESLEWICKLPSIFQMYVYNMGDSLDDKRVLDRITLLESYPPASVSTVYLHHILTKGKNDGDITVFSPGSPLSHSPDFFESLEQWSQWLETQPLSWRWLSQADIPPSALLNSCEKDLAGRLRIRPQQFSLSSWGPIDFEDPGALRTGYNYWEIEGLPSGGTNVAAHFLRRCFLDELAAEADAHDVGIFSYGPIFAVKNERISTLPRKSVEALLYMSMRQPVYSFVLERLWLHLFGVPFLRPKASTVRAVDSLNFNAGHQKPDGPRPPFVRTEENWSKVAQTNLNAGAGSLKTIEGKSDSDRIHAPQNYASRRRRLFISTGYFASTIAATIAANSDPSVDNYLLITIDRQDVKKNVQWAYQMLGTWRDVAVASHGKYYVENSNFSNPFECDFDEVYSTHFHMANFVRDTFKARSYAFFEEGLSTYEQASRLNSKGNGVKLHSLLPRHLSKTSLVNPPINREKFCNLLKNAELCYDIPAIDGNANVILLGTGVAPENSGRNDLSFDGYEQVATRFRAEGYQVWFKPHPRVPVEDVFTGSSFERAGVRLLGGDAPLIESILLANAGSISAIGSVYSSALIYAEPIFGVRAFSIPGRVAGVHQANLKAYQDARVASIGGFFERWPTLNQRFAQRTALL